MAKSERYIPPSDEELERWRKAMEAEKRFDARRESLLRTTLKKIRKADLIELMIRVVRGDRASAWALEREIELDKPVRLLVHDIELAIDKATEVDEPRGNCNPPIDWLAYEAVERGLSQLIQKGQYEEVKQLALKLIRKGSYQIECSDEGLMQEEIESCLKPVISSVSEWPGSSEWALEMLENDRMACICDEELGKLAGLGGD